MGKSRPLKVNMIHSVVFIQPDNNNSPLTEYLFIKIRVQLHVSATLRHPPLEDGRNMQLSGPDTTRQQHCKTLPHSCKRCVRRYFNRKNHVVFLISK
jgi:hypothetical protein